MKIKITNIIFCNFFILSLLIVFAGYAQKVSALKFKHLTTDDGLSSNGIYSVLQDKKGFLWAATHNGLNRYDGYRFKKYFFDPKNESSLPSNEITVLHEDTQGNLWVGSNGKGFCRYDQLKDRFVRYKELDTCIILFFFENQTHWWIFAEDCVGRLDKKTGKFENIGSRLPQKYFGSVCKSSNPDVLWVGTQGSGLYTLHVKTLEMKAFKHGKTQQDTLSSNDIRKVYLDQQGVLWIGYFTGGIMDRLNTHDLSVRHTFHQKNKPESLTSFQITCFLEEANSMWMGTQNGGLSIFDKATEESIHYRYDINQPAGLSNNSISTGGIYKDQQGRIWICTHFGGLNVVDTYYQKFSTLPITLPNPTVHAILKDSRQRLWIGTEGGIVKVEKTGTKTYLHFPVLSITEDPEGRIWLGSWEHGVNLYNEKTDSFVQFLQKQIDHNRVYSLIPSHGSYIWVLSHGALSKMSLDNLGQFKNYYGLCHFKKDYQGIHAQLIDQHIWIITHAGVIVFDPKTETSTCFQHEADNSKSLSADFATSMLYDSQKRFWIGTKEGLNLKTGKKTFERITTLQGLPSGSISSMLEDNKGNIWIAGNKGISKFNPQKRTFKNYDVQDGLQSNQFGWNACFKDQDGWFYFGGVKGLNVFRPDDILDNPYPPSVFINQLKIFNQPVEIGGRDGVLKQNILETQSITLDYTQAVFTLEFVALNFTNSQKNQYAYQLEGFDKDWNYVDTQRHATYTNLDAGTYVFKVKASNNDGVWNEKGVSLIIHILPPWWETRIFRFSLLILIASVVMIVFRWRIQNFKQRQKHLEKLVNERTQELTERNDKVLQQSIELKKVNDMLHENQHEITAQNEELSQQSQKLTLANNEIIQLNLTLEKKIKEKTLHLRTQNEKLKDYAYYNAHKIRGPLARILGLIILMQEESDTLQMTVYLSLLKIVADELDTKIKEINDILSDDDDE
jgi:ligand-binding sensor domain-containing protein